MQNNKKKEMVSDAIRRRLIQNNRNYSANSNIADVICDNELDLLREEVSEACSDLLRSLLIDITNDSNSKETPKRLAKMFIDEIFRGRYYPTPETTNFPNIKRMQDLYVLDNISVRSTCSHHFAPIIGKVSIGIIPNGELMGLSKFCRIVDWIMSRPQMQEEATMQLADELVKVINPQGLIVYCEAEHYCMKWRGVKEPNCNMHTSVTRGLFTRNSELELKFLNMVRK